MKTINPHALTCATPVEEFPGTMSKARIFIKRDDLNGLLISGNKARKMAYLVADAHRHGCDTLITCGGIQSNHCRTAAAFARRFGFNCHLFLRGKPGKNYTGNLLLDHLLGAHVNYVTPSQYTVIDDIMAEYAERLKKLGMHAYVIPEGGSNATGCLGYRDCMIEMNAFIRQQRIQAVYCAVGSGGTYAGLLLGKNLAGSHVHLNGIIVCDTVEFFKNKIERICTDALTMHKLSFTIRHKDITLIDGYQGTGYGIPYPEELHTIREVAKHGIILEPVYTGKTFYGMLQDIKRKKYRRVLFVHTGGIFSNFAYARILSVSLRGD
ncbi:D-cysteine desulfhydrase family protein [candidate division WOR-3 bacterium]|nr:D-cysteine desulfhydrase family protein [candidate division WOR-3 bacterium]